MTNPIASLPIWAVRSPAVRGFLLRWGVRLAVVFQVAFGWVPVAR